MIITKEKLIESILKLVAPEGMWIGEINTIGVPLKEQLKYYHHFYGQNGLLGLLVFIQEWSDTLEEFEIYIEEGKEFMIEVRDDYHEERKKLIFDELHNCDQISHVPSFDEYRLKYTGHTELTDLVYGGE